MHSLTRRAALGGLASITAAGAAGAAVAAPDPHDRLAAAIAELKAAAIAVDPTIRSWVKVTPEDPDVGMAFMIYGTR